MKSSHKAGGGPVHGEGEGEPRVIVRSRRARPLFARHPWLFAGSIERVEGNVSDGDEVTVYAHSGEFIARGLFNSQSQIRVRLYSWALEQPLDDSFWRGRLVNALRLRRDILMLNDPHGACRLVFSEADGLSGLVVDRYARCLIVQFTSFALAQRRELFIKHLLELCQPCGIYLRTERGIGDLEGLRLCDGPLWGDVPESATAILEHGLEFEVDLRAGQKTGFYIDQRENREAVAAYARGRRVLDMFCYTGAFALSAARAGASEVLGIDASQPAISLAQRNADRNKIANVRFETGDAFETMERLANETPGNPFGMVILDPPKFARQAQSVDQALRGYLRLNLLAVRLLQSDGILVSCSCSGHVSQEQFAAMLGTVAEQSGRSLQILSQRGQAADHPVSVSCLESQYLKCMITRVD